MAQGMNRRWLEAREKFEKDHPWMFKRTKSLNTVQEVNTITSGVYDQSNQGAVGPEEKGA